MDIQIDTREKKWELARIQRQLTASGANTFLSKLYVGDYLSLDNPRVVIDRKKDLLEVCSNVCQQHERFQRELCRARDAGIHIIFLVEHGDDVKNINDVYNWKNPRLKKSPKATTGKSLCKTLKTISERYGVEFEFCDKDETGEKIIKLLSDERG